MKVMAGPPCNHFIPIFWTFLGGLTFLVVLYCTYRPTLIILLFTRKLGLSVSMVLVLLAELAILAPRHQRGFLRFDFPCFFFIFRFPILHPFIVHNRHLICFVIFAICVLTSVGSEGLCAQEYIPFFADVGVDSVGEVQLYCNFHLSLENKNFLSPHLSPLFISTASNTIHPSIIYPFMCLCIHVFCGTTGAVVRDTPFVQPETL